MGAKVTTRKGGEKNLGGRPRVYDDPEEMQAAVDKYFETLGKKSVCGLASHLGFLDPQSLCDYAKDDRFSGVVRAAKLRVMAYYEEVGQDGKAGSFADRMLTRMNWQAVEASKIDARVSTLSDIAAAMGIDREDDDPDPDTD